MINAELEFSRAIGGGGCDVLTVRDHDYSSSGNDGAQ
jgi:hypothetical protein